MINVCVDPSCSLENKTPCEMPDPQHDVFVAQNEALESGRRGGHTPHRDQRRCAMITTATWTRGDSKIYAAMSQD